MPLWIGFVGSVDRITGTRNCILGIKLCVPGIRPDPVLPTTWLARVNEPQTEAEPKALRNCVRRRCPFGDEGRVTSSALRLGLQPARRPRGKPRRESWTGKRVCPRSRFKVDIQNLTLTTLDPADPPCRPRRWRKNDHRVHQSASR